MCCSKNTKTDGIRNRKRNYHGWPSPWTTLALLLTWITDPVHHWFLVDTNHCILGTLQSCSSEILCPTVTLFPVQSRPTTPRLLTGVMKRWQSYWYSVAWFRYLDSPVSGVKWVPCGNFILNGVSCAWQHTVTEESCFPCACFCFRNVEHASHLHTTETPTLRNPDNETIRSHQLHVDVKIQRI